MQGGVATRELTVAALLCFAFALALYVLTLAPTFGWGDSADLAMRMVDPTDTTFAHSSRNYAFYRSVAGLFQFLPFGDVGTRANLATAFFGAVTVGLVAWLSGYIAQHRHAAYAAGISLAVSHTFWLMSVIAEVYTFNAMWMFACYACIAVWWRTGRVITLAGAALFTGLSVLHHATGLVLAATIAPLVLARIRQLAWWQVSGLLIIFFAVSFPYWQGVEERLQLHLPLLRALELGDPSNPLFTASPLRELVKFIAYATYNFLGFAAVLAIWGLSTAWRRRLWELLPPVLWFCLLVYAGLTSSIPDKFNIYVLVYPVIALLVGMGAARLGEVWALTNKRGLMLWFILAATPPLGYLVAIKTASALQLDLIGARVMPYRDNDWYFMWPAKNGDDGPRRYATQAFEEVKPRGVLIADYSLWRPLYFLQAVEKVRPDVTLLWAEKLVWQGGIATVIKKIPCSQDVYLAADGPAAYYQLDELRKYYTLKPQGMLLKVVRDCR